ncbi:hypothetical protein POM88_003685 [Heracleum sosnowskyi]|uniref:Uncharacterized protein n=1 Tax=Heracleum sosnowskyi TaxID=360622 RepID=A0AAD8JLC0_9APIA|nr:hypothetical protein POM88_003685 [Heracleum sosnowskyi]
MGVEMHNGQHCLRWIISNNIKLETFNCTTSQTLAFTSDATGKIIIKYSSKFSNWHPENTSVSDQLPISSTYDKLLNVFHRIVRWWPRERNSYASVLIWLCTCLSITVDVKLKFLP